MITSPFLLVLLLAILSTITKQQPANADFKPDWSKCGSLTTCFCLDDSTKTLMVHKPPAPRSCNVGAQNRFFTEDSAVYQIQVLENAVTIGENPKLILALETKEIFGCEFDTKTGKVTLKGDEDMLKKSKMQLFESRSQCKEKFCICAVKVSSATEMVKGTKNIPSSGNKFMKIKYTTTKPEEYSFNDDGVDFFVAKIIKCAAYSFNDLTDLQGKHVLPIINRDHEYMDCKSVYGDSYRMRYIHEGTTHDMDKLWCKTDKTDTNNANFEIIDKEDKTNADNSITTTALDPELFTFYCEAEINEVCGKPKEECKSEPCPFYDKGAKNKPATLTCPGKKWLLGGEYVVLDSEPVCKEDIITNPNDAAFFINRDSHSEKKVDGANDRCFTEYDCKQKSTHVQFGTRLHFSSDIVKCEDPKEDLSIFFFEKNVTLKAKNITCDKSDGYWKDTMAKSVSEGELISEAASVSCHVDPESLRTKVGAAMSDAKVYSIIGGTLLVTLLLLAAGFGGYYLHDKRRRGVHDSKAWNKLDPAGKLKYCEGVFDSVLKMDTISRTHIVHGWRLVDLLLDTETADPKIWNAAYPFLTRFHGAIRNTDTFVYNMFTRYLILEAKKIIRKHKWIAEDDEKPIRKSKKDQPGLMRVVAIRMLGFCLDNAHGKEAHDLLEQGCRKMGFQAVENYPHCGVMWAMITHARARKMKRKLGGDAKQFAYEGFNGVMRDILVQGKMTMPENQVIPEFGQVYEQAAFALGGIQNITYHEESGHEIVYDEQGTNENQDAQHAKGTPFAFMRGLCFSLTANPPQLVMGACNIWTEYKKEKLEKLREVMGLDKLNELITETIRFMAYYGRMMDCKRFEERLMPETEQPSALLSGLVIEQQNFENAMNNELESLREWFAANTDKKEWKDKPVYNTDPTITLDERAEVYDEKAQEAGECDKTVARRVKNRLTKRRAGKQNPAPVPAETASSSKRPADSNRPAQP